MVQRRFRALSALVVTVLAASAVSVVSVVAQPLGTAFPYQGRLQDNGAPANGLYDFQFQIYDAAVGGGQVGPTVIREDVAVGGGLFTTSLDFGGGVFTGNARWLEIAVRPGASGGAFTPIGGRQELQPTPNALFAAATGGLVPPVTINYAGQEALLTTIGTAAGDPVTPVAGIYSLINNTQGVRPALQGEVNTTLGNPSAAGVLGVTSGTGGNAGVFRAINPAGNGTALRALNDGNGHAIVAEAKSGGTGIWVSTTGTGDAVLAHSSNGTAIRAFNTGPGNNKDVVNVLQTNDANGVDAKVQNANATEAAIKGEIISSFLGVGTAGVYGVASGLGGYGGYFAASNGSGSGTAVYATAEGSGHGVIARAENNGNGITTSAAGSGSALFAATFTGATGRAITAANTSAANGNDTVNIDNNATVPHTTVRVTDAGNREARLVTNTHAAYFVGDVHVTGNLSKGSGAFKIDHPLDPANKYLSHSFVESPDMKNVYDGVATLDANGEAAVTLPHYFEALNRDFRYQLTAVGGPAPSLHVASKISNGVFRIAGGTPGLEISWQITGIRKDQTALHNPIVVEQEKSSDDRGLYLDPAAFGLPADKGIGWKPREDRNTASPNQQ